MAIPPFFDGNPSFLGLYIVCSPEREMHPQSGKCTAEREMHPQGGKRTAGRETCLVGREMHRLHLQEQKPRRNTFLASFFLASTSKAYKAEFHGDLDGFLAPPALRPVSNGAGFLQH